MPLIHVEFDWSDEKGLCVDCGLPAAYLAAGRYGPSSQSADLLCSVCAAGAAANDGASLTHLFED